MEIDSSELEKYVRSSVVAISNGVRGTDFKVIKPILFDLAVINTIEGAGEFKIFIAKADGRLKSDETSRIRFEVQPISEVRPYKPSRPKENPAL
ncbi:MAG: hypothetical protein G01um101420_463 [Parcubacteria group bacterium Gr01-1014_20]|nr:MAG: hypothetical protein G01um101420_463 [Parcubacteria group bacterium Gr01-1014_20]